MDAALTKLIDAVFGALDLFRVWVVLYEYERGVMLRLGRFHRELGPGWHWRVPFKIEELRFVNVRRKTSASWEQTLTTTDGAVVTVAFDYVVEVQDAKAVLLGMDDWSAVAYNTAKMAMARVVQSGDLASVLDGGFCARVRAAVSAALLDNGIALRDFAITDRCRSRAYRLYKGSH